MSLSITPPGSVSLPPLPADATHAQATAAVAPAYPNSGPREVISSASASQPLAAGAAGDLVDVGFSAKFKMGETGTYSSLEVWVHIGGKVRAEKAEGALDTFVEFVERALDRNAEHFVTWGNSLGQHRPWSGPTSLPPAPPSGPGDASGGYAPPPPAGFQSPVPPDYRRQ